MDGFKNEIFTISYDHKLKTWKASGTSYIFYGKTGDHWLRDDEKEIAPALALLDLLGYDIDIIAHELGVTKN